MNAARSRSAADQVARAVQNIARSATQAHNAEPGTVTATVLYREQPDAGAITAVDIDGALFRRSGDQAEYQRGKRLQQIGDRLVELGGDEADHLLGELEQLWMQRDYDAIDHRMHCVAGRLIDASQQGLWDVIYQDWREGSVVEPGDAFNWYLDTDGDRGSGWTP